MALKFRVFVFFAAVALLLSTLPYTQARDIVEITDANFDELVTPDSPWLIDFYADWCGVCRRFEGELYQLSHQIDAVSPNVNIGKVNVDENPGLSLKFFISRLPSIYFIYQGEIRTWNTSLEHEAILSALSKDEWKNMEVWSGMFSPFGIFGKMFGFFGYIQSMINTVIPTGIPSLVIILVISAITGLLVFRVYKSEPNKPVAATKSNRSVSSSESTPSSSPKVTRRRSRKID
ncbi:hypothetical protein K7432_004079 [Basidiobolus ranarum]|uniref:Thioredoxin domain-containing protein n=1 Tax=Basidiobolus ranarum TaxID=34480 RepID=A0ABR2W5J0_9FUNG